MPSSPASEGPPLSERRDRGVLLAPQPWPTEAIPAATSGLRIATTRTASEDPPAAIRDFVTTPTRAQSPASSRAPSADTGFTVVRSVSPPRRPPPPLSAVPTRRATSPTAAAPLGGSVVAVRRASPPPQSRAPSINQNGQHSQQQSAGNGTKVGERVPAAVRARSPAAVSPPSSSFSSPAFMRSHSPSSSKAPSPHKSRPQPLTAPLAVPVGVPKRAASPMAGAPPPPLPDSARRHLEAMARSRQPVRNGPQSASAAIRPRPASPSSRAIVAAQQQQPFVGHLSGTTETPRGASPQRLTPNMNIAVYYDRDKDRGPTSSPSPRSASSASALKRHSSPSSPTAAKSVSFAKAQADAANGKVPRQTAEEAAREAERRQRAIADHLANAPPGLRIEQSTRVEGSSTINTTSRTVERGRPVLSLALTEKRGQSSTEAEAEEERRTGTKKNKGFFSRLFGSGYGDDDAEEAVLSDAAAGEAALLREQRLAAGSGHYSQSEEGNLAVQITTTRTHTAAERLSSQGGGSADGRAVFSNSVSRTVATRNFDTAALQRAPPIQQSQQLQRSNSPAVFASSGGGATPRVVLRPATTTVPSARGSPMRQQSPVNKSRSASPPAIAYAYRFSDANGAEHLKIVPPPPPPPPPRHRNSPLTGGLSPHPRSASASGERRPPPSRIFVNTNAPPTRPNTPVRRGASPLVHTTGGGHRVVVTPPRGRPAPANISTSSINYYRSPAPPVSAQQESIVRSSPLRRCASPADYLAARRDASRTGSPLPQQALMTTAAAESMGGGFASASFPQHSSAAPYSATPARHQPQLAMVPRTTAASPLRYNFASPLSTMQVGIAPSAVGAVPGTAAISGYPLHPFSSAAGAVPTPMPMVATESTIADQVLTVRAAAEDARRAEVEALRSAQHRMYLAAVGAPAAFSEEAASAAYGLQHQVAELHSRSVCAPNAAAPQVVPTREAAPTAPPSADVSVAYLKQREAELSVLLRMAEEEKDERARREQKERAREPPSPIRPAAAAPIVATNETNAIRHSGAESEASMLWHAERIRRKNAFAAAASAAPSHPLSAAEAAAPYPSSHHYAAHPLYLPQSVNADKYGIGALSRTYGGGDAAAPHHFVGPQHHYDLPHEYGGGSPPSLAVVAYGAAQDAISVAKADIYTRRLRLDGLL